MFPDFTGGVHFKLGIPVVAYDCLVDVKALDMCYLLLDERIWGSMWITI